MKRKDFLQRLAAASTGLLFTKFGWSRPDPILPTLSALTPPYLKPGDTIGITCPASPMEVEDLQQCTTAIERWGLKFRYGNTVNAHWERFGGTDADRATDLQQMLDDDKINVILFGRGGYGVMRMMDKLNWSKFMKKPKWLVGYSDITAIHCQVHNVCGIPTIHADMGNGFGDEEDASSLSLKKMLMGEMQPYRADPFALNRYGEAWGKLVGGNLSLVTAMLGSPSALNTNGKILFIEDVSEYKYTVDRMMLMLKRSGLLSNLAGLVVGGFTAVKKDEEEIEPIKDKFLMTIEDIICEKVAEYSYPVCFRFPAGHQKVNLALKLGASYHLQVDGTQTLLAEGTPPGQMLQSPLQGNNKALIDSLLKSGIRY